MSETLHLTPHEHVTVRRASAAALEVDVTYLPGGGPPPGHLHPAQDERFEVLAGELHVRLDGELRTLRAGDVLEIPRGVPHQMWNPGDEETRALWETRPAGRTLEWYRALDAAGRGRERPALPVMAALLGEYRDVFRLTAGPEPLVRGALAVLALAGRGRAARLGARAAA